MAQSAKYLPDNYKSSNPSTQVLFVFFFLKEGIVLDTSNPSTGEHKQTSGAHWPASLKKVSEPKESPCLRKQGEQSS